MSRPGRRPGLRRRATRAPWAGLVAVGLLGAACGTTGSSPADASTATTVPWVVGTGGTLTIGIDRAPTGCNPNTASGDTWADRLVLAPVLPGAFDVNGKDQPVYNSAVINQAELQSTSPQTVVYNINPQAVWSDGVPITAADFVYTWQQERGTGGPVVPPPGSGPSSSSGSMATAASADGSGTVGSSGAAGTGAASAAAAPGAGGPGVTGVLGPAPTTLPGATGTTGTLMGYRQIKSIKGSAHGRTVTVVFRTRYADWQALFNDLLPAHVLTKKGWDPSCATVDPSIDLSGGPYVISSVIPGKQVVLSRNPRWWAQAGNAARIVIKTASGSAQLARWLATGRVQVALPTGFDQQFVARVSASPSTESQGQQSTTFLQLEMSTTGPATAYLPVRQAIAHAIDRQQLVNQVVGWADTAIVPATSHLYAESQNGYPSPRQLPIQIAQASSTTTTTTTIPAPPTPAQPFPTTADLATTDQLLSQAGLLHQPDGTWKTPDGKAFRLRLAVDTGNAWAARAAPLIVHQLGAAGIPTTVVAAPTATAAGADLSSGGADLALLPMHSSPFATTAIAWYTELLGPPGTAGSQDWSNFTDPSLDNLLMKASQQLNPVDASPLYTQADMLLWQQMVALPLFTEPAVMAWSASVGGVQTDLNGPNVLTTVANWGIKVPPDSPRAVATGTHGG